MRLHTSLGELNLELHCDMVSSLNMLLPHMIGYRCHWLVRISYNIVRMVTMITVSSTAPLETSWYICYVITCIVPGSAFPPPPSPRSREEIQWLLGQVCHNIPIGQLVGHCLWWCSGGQSIWGKPFKDEFRPNLSHSGRCTV